MTQLAHSRNRTPKPATAKLGVANVRVSGTTSSRVAPTLAMLAGAALGGVAMYKGHLMAGAGLMAAGLITGSMLEGKDT